MSPRHPAGDRAPWWKGTRGEWFVIIQLLLMALLLFGPRTVAGWPPWRFPFPHLSRLVGIVLMVGGGGFLLAGVTRLGKSLTPLPYPRDEATLVQSGPFALVRHPLYSGGLVFAIGWALFVRGWLTFGFVVLLFVLLDVKSRREERWLAEKFPAYPAYQRRVRKLIPFL